MFYTLPAEPGQAGHREFYRSTGLPCRFRSGTAPGADSAYTGGPRPRSDAGHRVVPVATLLLLRHGRTTANADGGLAGRQPVELDETGRAQASAVGERLRAVPLAAVVTSPLIRCRQTLELALPEADAGGRGRADRVRVRRLGGAAAEEAGQGAALAGGPAAPQRGGLPGRARRWRRCRPARSPRCAPGTPGSPPSTGPEAVWLACSHGDVIKAIVADALGLHLDLFQRIVADPASVTVDPVHAAAAVPGAAQRHRWRPGGAGHRRQAASAREPRGDRRGRRRWRGAAERQTPP